ncbi:MAG: CBS domain-containing protein [Deltaproteobacteria bacterium]|nr:CBS domain-containing protein [Deltaproteobacteria bacterium]
MLVKDIMTENPVTAIELMSVAEALGLLYELDVRHLPVVRGRELVGIISDRDLRSFSEAAEDEAIEAVEGARSSTVGSFMNTSPVKVDPETPIREVIELLGHSRGRPRHRRPAWHRELRGFAAEVSGDVGTDDVRRVALRC